MQQHKYIYLHNGKVLVCAQQQWCHDKLAGIKPAPWHPQALLIANKNDACVYLQLLAEDTDLPTSTLSTMALPMSLMPARELFGLVNEADFALIAKALQLSHWWQDHQYCGRCGASTKPKAAYLDFGLSCSACQLVQYPRLSPCIIVAITGPKGLLLGRSPHFAKGRYSTLAGFVEVGESAEDAVHREVFEEVSVNIEKVNYMFSQTWPFPHSLMLGYLAHYQSGDIQVDGIEIEDAQWFHPDNLPDLPDKNTIARKLINLALARLRE